MSFSDHHPIRLTVSFVLLSLCLLVAAWGQETTKVASAGEGSQQENERTQSTVRMSLADAVKLATLNNSELKVAYFDRLLAMTSVKEAEAAFDTTYFANFGGGESEVSFIFLFPGGPPDPVTGEPANIETLINNSTTVLNGESGFRGTLMTGATWNLQTATAYRNSEAGSVINPSYSTTTSLNFTQPILQNAWQQYNEASIQQARNTETIAHHTYQNGILGKVLETHQAFWNYVFAIKDLEVKKSSLGVAERLLEINRVKVRTGVFAPIEITSAEAGVASRKTDVIVAENSIKDREDDLRRLVMPFHDRADWSVSILPVFDESMPFVKLPTLDELIDISMVQRPELREARLNLRNLAIDVAMADNQFLPTLDFIGSVGWTTTNGDIGASFSDQFNENGAQSWNLGLSLEIPLGRRASHARLARARLERDKAIAGYRDIQLTIVEGMRKAYRAVLTAERSIDSTMKAAELKEQELKNEQVKLENRVSTNFQVLQIEDELAQTRTQVISARFNYRTALATLANAMGTTLETLAWQQKSER